MQKNIKLVEKKEDQLKINTGALELVLGLNNIVSLDMIKNCQSGKEWNTPFDSFTPFWKIYFLGEDGTSPAYMSSQGRFCGASILKDSGPVEIELLWEVAVTVNSECKVRVKIRCEESSNLSYWRIEVEPPKDFKITQIDFPVLPNIKHDKEARLFAPAGFGVEYSLQAGFSYEGPYPSWLTAYQMVAIHHGCDGLYFAAHDPGAHLKDFIVKGQVGSVHCSVANWTKVEEAENGVYTLPFEFVVGVYEGTYYEAAQIYRSFAVESPWGKNAVLSDREIPEWILKSDICIRPDGAPEDNVEITKKAFDFFDVPAFLHWYRWHVTPYDTCYPEYFPALPNFTEAVKELSDYGSPVACYINGRLWDPDSKSWEEEKAYESAARKRNGECYSEIYGNCIPNNVMCPYTEQWQDKVTEVVQTLFYKYGLDGVYVDQIAAAMGVPCYNKDHGHPVGGGTYWKEGYDVMLEKIHSIMGKEHLLITEENAECWIDKIEVHLTVNTPADGLRPVPIYPAIYSDRTILVGTQYYAENEPADAISFNLKNARAFLWGAQIGWIEPARIMNPEVKDQALYLKTLAKTRSYAHDFVVGGKFSGMVEVKGNVPRILHEANGPFGGVYAIDEPGVLASFWLSVNGQPGIMLTNYSDQEVEAEIKIPLERANSSVDYFQKVRIMGADGLEKEIKLNDSSFFISMPPLSAFVGKVE